MNTMTKEWLQQAINDYESVRDEIPFGLDDYQGKILAALRIALASLEAKPIYQLWDEGYYDTQKETYDAVLNAVGTGVRGRIVYTAPPAPANAEPVAWRYRTTDINGNPNPHWLFSEEASLLGLYQPLYAAPPAPVSVPDEANPENIEILASTFAPCGVTYQWDRDECNAAADSWNACRAAMLQGADGTLTNEDAKLVGELVMWVKRLAHSLRKANPDSKLQSDAMDCLSRKGLIGVGDILR